MEHKYEHIKFIIQRFDHFYDTVNNKGSFYIGVNTFIFGGICVGYTNLYNAIHPTISIWICLFLLVASCILSTVITIEAIKPYLKDNHANNVKPSLMYFEGIAKHEFFYLREKFEELSLEQLTEDALQQMHSLARGLTWKFKKLRMASYLLQCQFVLLIPLIFFIIKNLK